MILERIKNIFRNPDLISDGWHTFEELYNVRHALFIIVALYFKESAFKTLKNNDGTVYNDYFLLYVNTVEGQVSFHLPQKYWEYCSFATTTDKNDTYDGHTTIDVYLRLLKIAERLGKGEDLRSSSREQ